LKEFFAKSKDNDPSSYTTDPKEINTLWKQGRRLFKAFLRGRFIVLDIDRKPGKVDGLENFYKLCPPQVLPAELQNIEGGSFPCWATTPSGGGIHLFFRYEGAELKIRELAPSIEIKEWQITAPGSNKENGEYVLHGKFSDVQPFYGFFLDRIEKIKADAERKQEKTEHSRPRTETVAEHPIRSRVALDDLADEAVTAYTGNHDRQVSFAGKAFRCKYSGAEALAYVKTRTDIFGNGSDTENTVMSVFRDNGGHI
jgi:hypothetical protein